ncbi:glycoside hydrolase family 10 protein [Nocardiopsis coralliicola]
MASGCTAAPDGRDEAAADAPPIPAECEQGADHAKREMRGAWATTVRNLDWPSADDLSAEEQQAELRDQLDQVRDLGLNTVFLQVRSTADAMYESDKEPWARYLTGEQGGDPGYDPLQFAVEEAQARGLELHAWFNPYRVGHKEPDLAGLTDDHPAVRNPEWLVEYAEEGWLDPGNPEVQEWVSDVVLDVVDRYDIDGVHFDDFFYPYPSEGAGEFDDDASFAAHGGGEDREDWRRANVDALVADVHGRIQDTKPWVRFGISPFGIYRNAENDPAGSDTQGLESYSAQYADTLSWVESGTVDYLAPQLYWERGLSNADYEELLPWWADAVDGSGVDLYVGQAAYRVGEGGVWDGDDALSRQLDFNAEHEAVEGDIYYGLSDILDDNAAVRQLAEDHYGTPALPPQADGGEGHPDAVQGLEAERTGDGAELTWDPVDGARSYAVYRVPDDQRGDECALGGSDNLVGIAGPGEQPSFTDGGAGDDAATYQVTALDRYRTEGAPADGARVGSAEG